MLDYKSPWNADGSWKALTADQQEKGGRRRAFHKTKAYEKLEHATNPLCEKHKGDSSISSSSADKSRFESVRSSA
jgi:hypothetical protein